MTESLSVNEVEYIAFRLAKKHLAHDEPIPDFATRYSNILESCLVVPFQKYTRKSLYKGLSGKAAILFYLMIKNHPFQNGNKRIAMTALMVFLYKNSKWLKVDNKELYNFSMWVAQSPPAFKEETVRATEKFINSHLV